VSYDEVTCATNVIAKVFFEDFCAPTTPLPVAFNFGDVYYFRVSEGRLA